MDFRSIRKRAVTAEGAGKTARRGGTENNQARNLFYDNDLFQDH